MTYSLEHFRGRSEDASSKEKARKSGGLRVNVRIRTGKGEGRAPRHSNGRRVAFRKLYFALEQIHELYPLDLDLNFEH